MAKANAEEQGLLEGPGVPKTSIQTIDRAVAMLEQIAQAGPSGISPSALAQSVGLLLSTSRSLLSSLMAHGFVDQHADRKYVLGAGFLEVHRIYAAQVDLATVAAPILREVWEDTRETVHLSVLRNDRRIELSVLVSPQVLNVNPSSGARSASQPEASLFYTAAGKMLLTSLDDDHLSRILKRAGSLVGREGAIGLKQARAVISQVRAQGYATNRDEDVAGVCGVAAPVFDDQDKLCATLCIGYPTIRRTDEYESGLRSRVINAAEQLSQLLGRPTQGEAAPDHD